MTKTITISPFTRVEGDLVIRLDLKEGRVAEAWASGVMFRGFELLLQGRGPMDGLVFTPRICGICCSAHSIAAANALRSICGARVPANAFYGRNLVFGTETVMSHLTHFYALFAADLTNEAYRAYPWYDEVVKRFTPFTGGSYQRLLKERKRFLEIIGLLVGKWPNHLGFQPGGMTCSLNFSDLARAKGILIEFQDFVEEMILGCPLEHWLAITSLDELRDWTDRDGHAPHDLAFFIRLALELGLHTIGKGPERFLSYGAYEISDQVFWLGAGLYSDGRIISFEQEKITEDFRYAWFKGEPGGRHPFGGTSAPDMEKPGAYSWTKAPRYEGRAVEVGPLARMIINQEPLITDLFHKLGANVFTRTMARWHEAIKVLGELHHWLSAIDLKEPFYNSITMPETGVGVGLAEAARGCLGHWVAIENNKIKSYQVITPTAWNASPQDSNNTPGAIEAALVGLAVQDEENPVEAGHVIRSFDPCLVCSVHCLRGQEKIASYSLHP